MSDFANKLYKHNMFRGRTPEGKEVYGALVPEGSLAFKAAPGLPPIVMWHLVQRSTIDGKICNEDELVDLSTVEISLGWEDEHGRAVYVPLADVAAMRAEVDRLHRENFWLTGHKEGEQDGTA